MVACHRQSPCRSNETSGDDELRFVTETGIALFVLRKIAVDDFVEDCRVRYRFVPFINAITYLPYFAC
jgi:hypothetical protein